eukprot:365830-Chlamydomonas_euryale.AAC.1
MSEQIAATDCTARSSGGTARNRSHAAQRDSSANGTAGLPSGAGNRVHEHLGAVKRPSYSWGGGEKHPTAGAKAGSSRS